MHTNSFFRRIRPIFILLFLLPALCAGCSSLPVSGQATEQALVINEVVSSNSTSLSHPELGSPDWIELYNGTNATIDLSGFGLSDNVKEPHKWTFPEGTTIPAGGYLLIYACSYTGEDDSLLCTDFGLSKNGESLLLTDAYYAILQQVDLPALLPDVSYARDASGQYGYCSDPTPGKENGEVVFSSAGDAITAGTSDALTITECMPKAGACLAPDGKAYPWAELYNSGSEPLLLSDYYLSDNIHEPLKWRLPGATLEAGAYTTIWFSGDEGKDGIHAGFRLGSSDDTLVLSDSTGNQISILTWPMDQIPEGVCVLPGGQYTAQATPGQPNSQTGLFSSLEFAPAGANAAVRIQELLLHNQYSLRDETGERTPWVELYNSSGQAVSLGGCYLSDDPENPFKWAFPEASSIQPGQYLVIFLSGKDAAGDALHTSFRLSDSDEALVFTQTSTMSQDQWALPTQLGDNVSMGLAADGSIAYFTTPTPGAANTTHSFTEPLNGGYTDMEGVYISEVSAVSAAKSGKADWIELHNASDSKVDLAGWHLSDDADDLQKCTLESMTLDAGGYGVVTASSSTAKGATAPFGISPTGETLFLSDAQGNIRDVFQTGALRLGVTAGRSAGSASRVYYTEATRGEANGAQSYTGFLPTPVFSEMGLYHDQPFSLTITCDAPDATIHYTLDGSEPTEASPVYTGLLTIQENTPVRAKAFGGGLLSSDVATATYLFETPHTLPVVCLSAQSDDWDAMYSVTERKFRVEKPGHFAYYETDGALGTAFGCGLRASGSSTLLARQKSVAVFLRGAYGQSETNYPFFTDSDVTVFSSLVLRNSGQDRDKARLRDSFFSKAVKGLNMEYAETRLVIVYVNGQYWGIYDLNENQNEDYMAAHYGVDPDAVDIIRRNIEALAGRNSENKRVRAWALATDTSDPDKYAEYIQWVDPDYFIDYLIAQTYFANGDMFNQKYWRSQDYTVRWRPVYYDLDLALSSSSPTRNILPNYFNAEGIPSQDGSLTNMDLYVGLRKNPDWCLAFGERYVYVVYNYFDPDRLTAILDDMVNQLRPEMARHIQRWGAPSSMDKWETEVAELRECLQARQSYALKYLQREFDFTDAQMAQWEQAAKAAASTAVSPTPAP